MINNLPKVRLKVSYKNRKQAIVGIILIVIFAALYVDAIFHGEVVSYIYSVNGDSVKIYKLRPFPIHFFTIKYRTLPWTDLKLVERIRKTGWLSSGIEYTFTMNSGERINIFGGEPRACDLVAGAHMHRVSLVGFGIWEKTCDKISPK
jgi:hypothetical protein